MRSSLFVFAFLAVAIASPVPDSALESRDIEARGGYYYPVFGGFGGTAKSGDSGNANGGNVVNKASPWGSVTNAFGSCESTSSHLTDLPLC